MKRLIPLISVIFVLVSISLVSAIPKNFEVSNVYWASEGTIEGKPFLLGLVELSWEGGKGKTSSLIVYLNYNGERYYSDSLGLIKDTDQIKKGITEAQFYPLEIYALEKGKDKITKYTLILPISQNGKINFKKARFSRLNKDLTIPNSFRTEQSDVNNLFPEVSNLVSCSKSISYDTSSTKKCGDEDDYTEETIDEYLKCIEENKKINSITFDCSILCLKNYYEESLLTQKKDFGKCSIYNIEFTKVSSEAIDFNELTKLNKNLEQFNPWRSGP